jgi:DNA-binding FrmR family transcriptional regulator
MSSERRKIRNRVSRIAGQVNGIQRMVDNDAYCVDILTQIAAVRSALDALGVELLTSHIESCVAGHGMGTAHACAAHQTPESLVDEVRTTLARFLK